MRSFIGIAVIGVASLFTGSVLAAGMPGSPQEVAFSPVITGSSAADSRGSVADPYAVSGVPGSAQEIAIKFGTGLNAPANVSLTDVQGLPGSQQEFAFSPATRDQELRDPSAVTGEKTAAFTGNPNDYPSRGGQ